MLNPKIVTGAKRIFTAVKVTVVAGVLALLAIIQKDVAVMQQKINEATAPKPVVVVTPTEVPSPTLTVTPTKVLLKKTVPVATQSAQ